jgi:hypothetical protein
MLMLSSPFRSYLALAPSLLLAALPLLAQTSNRGQLLAQQQGQYAYTPFTAMGAPVVLPMDGRLEQADWLTGLDVSLGGVLFPHLHVDTAIGTAGRPQGELQVGHHDPSQNGFTWQNIEFGLSGRFNETFEAFGTYAANVNPDGEFAGIYEEWFAKAQNLPGGFELRGGRIYNRFGIQNTYHPHGFDWADQYLVNARLLGEDSMTILGGDITWKLPVSWTSQLDVAVGVAPDGHEPHEHGEGEEPEFDAEGAAFDGTMTVANWTNIYHYNDFHQYRAGLSGAWGDNQYGRNTSIYGVHLEYQWRENGFEAGGRYFRWRTEAMWRQWGAVGGLALEGQSTLMSTKARSMSMKRSMGMKRNTMLERCGGHRCRTLASTVACSMAGLAMWSADCARSMSRAILARGWITAFALAQASPTTSMMRAR